MDIGHFLTWFIAIATVMGVGLGSMVWGYRGSGSISILFPHPISVPPSLPYSEATNYFQQGYDAYLKGSYRQALERFEEAIQLCSTLAEAYHNRGLVLANLCQDDDAVANLVKAGELYVQQGNQAGIIVIKKSLEALKTRKQVRAK
jgi:tetratricopeptide (TPR) repeat protein